MRNLFLVLGTAFLAGGLSMGAASAAEAGDAAEIAKQVKTYPFQTCVVSGAKLGAMGKPVDILHNGRLVRFCCKGCVKKFKAHPEIYLKKIDEAAKAKGAAQGAEHKAGGHEGHKHH